MTDGQETVPPMSNTNTHINMAKNETYEEFVEKFKGVCAMIESDVCVIIPRDWFVNGTYEAAIQKMLTNLR